MNFRLLVFIPLAAIQLLVPGWMIHREEQTLRHGRVFKLKTMPVDPYDAFRGRYVALRFEAESNPVQSMSGVGTKSVWVRLETDSNSFASVKEVSATPLAGDDVIAAKYTYGRLEFPFNAYYMDEDKAPAAEAAYRANSSRAHENAYATVRVLNGHAALEELYIDDKPIREFLRSEGGK